MARVQVYWLSRGSIPLGVYWDYVFYDSHDKVIGAYRRFVD